MTEETVIVEIPKTVVNKIERREWFKYYSDFKDFVLEAIRAKQETWLKATIGTRKMVRMYEEAKAEDPTLKFVDFLDKLA